MNKIEIYEYGLAAESLVCDYLENLGYVIVSRRYKCVWGEIDIIANEQATTVFIEVKARKKLINREIITSRQIKRVTNAANHYISKFLDFSTDFRFDYILVADYRIVDHLKNAWMDTTL